MCSENSQGPGGASGAPLSPGSGRGSGRVEDSESTAVMLMAFAIRFAFKVPYIGYSLHGGAPVLYVWECMVIGSKADGVLRYLVALIGFRTHGSASSSLSEASPTSSDLDCLCRCS